MKREIAQLLVGAASAIAVAGSMAACATSAPYGPAATPARVGYFDQQIENDRYRVSYRGPSGMGRAEVEDLALLRAADIALERGFDWFQIVGRSGDVGRPTTPRFSFGLGGSSFGRNSAVGAGASTGFGGRPAYIANLELVMGRGVKPPTPDAYDARSVASVIRPRAPL